MSLGILVSIFLKEGAVPSIDVAKDSREEREISVQRSVSSIGQSCSSLVCIFYITISL